MNLVLDTHTHTVASGHAYNTINEMAYAAAQKGLHLLAITEHAPSMPGSCHEFYFHNLRALRREKYGVKLLFGCELNIIDKEGNVDLPTFPLNQIDLGIASMHTTCYQSGTREENTGACLAAMDNPWVDIIGHPDDGRFPVDYRKLAQAAKEKHVLLELNNSSLKPNGFRKDSRENGITLLQYCKEFGTPIVLGSDAHVEEDVGNFGFALELLREVDFPEELVMNRCVEAFLEYAPHEKITTMPSSN
jgi:putative hydrolase